MKASSNPTTTATTAVAGQNGGGGGHSILSTATSSSSPTVPPVLHKINPISIISSSNQSELSNLANLQENNYHKEWILESIDKLRDRKARPDVDRISVLMKRLHNVAQADTQRCLDKLADMGQVICVDYKGNVSYRNPRKWRKCGSSCVLNPPSVGKMLFDVAQNLTNMKKSSQNPDLSFNALDIENGLQGKISLLGNRLEIILDRECAYGCLTRRADGRYVLDDARDKKRSVGSFCIKPRSNVKPKSLIKTTVKNICSGPVVSLSNNGTAMASFAFVSNGVSQSSSTATVSTTASGNSVDVGAHPYSYQPGVNRPFLLPAPPSSVNASNHSSVNSSNTVLATIDLSQSSQPQQQLHHMNRKATFGHRRGRPPAIQPKRAHLNIASAEVISGVNGDGNQHANKIARLALNNNNTVGNNVCDTLFSNNMGTSHNVNDSLRPDSSSNKQHSLLMEVRCSECKEGSSAEKKIYSCSTCRIRAHLGCLGFWVSEPMEPATWQCPKCIVCRICRKRDSLDRLLVCATCTRAYHSQCHEPHVDDNIEIFQPWVCEPCDSQGFYFIPHGHEAHNCNPANSSLSGVEEAFPTSAHDVTPTLLSSTVVDKALAESTTYLIANDNDVVNPSLTDDKTHHIPFGNKVVSNEADSMPSLSREEDYSNGPVTTSAARSKAHQSNSASPSNLSSPSTDNKTVTSQNIKNLPINQSKTAVNPSVSSTGTVTTDAVNLTETMVNNWSVQDVVSWLDYQGYSRESKLFLEQEIDGSSLLLMRQMDLLTQLGLKLGPAVKILQLLKKIQVDEPI